MFTLTKIYAQANSRNVYIATIGLSVDFLLV